MYSFAEYQFNSIFFGFWRWNFFAFSFFFKFSLLLFYHFLARKRFLIMHLVRSRLISFSECDRVIDLTRVIFISFSFRRFNTCCFAVTVFVRLGIRDCRCFLFDRDIVFQNRFMNSKMKVEILKNCFSFNLVLGFFPNERYKKKFYSEMLFLFSW